MSDMLNSLRFKRLLLAGIGILSAFVFIIDTQIPLGVSGGAAYVLFIMATYWMKGRKVTLAAGILGTFLIIAGFIFSISTKYIILSGVNHFMTIVVVWASVWFVNNYKTSVDQLRKNYRVLFQAANDEILVYHLDKNNRPGSFLEVNDTACNILGYSRDELLQKSIYDIVAAGKEELDRRIDEVINYEEAVYETRHLTKQGDIIPLELSVRSFTYNGRKTIISVGRDLSERLKLEQEILNVSELERQRIGRDMHDDLGQLLSVATLTAQMLGREMKARGVSDAEKVQKLADMIKTAGERTRTLSHGLVPVNVELNGLSGALQELADSVTNMYDVDITCTVDINISPDNSSSAVHLYRIAQEAINNAVKHGNATSIEVELSSSDDHITLYVRDNGSGFPEYRTRREGIGLRTMNFRANMIGGNLKINSKKGEGTQIVCQIQKSNFAKK